MLIGKVSFLSTTQPVILSVNNDIKTLHFPISHKIFHYKLNLLRLFIYLFIYSSRLIFLIFRDIELDEMI